ncbi:MAG: c-type cytochrome, partial [Thermomonas sp.]
VIKHGVKASGMPAWGKSMQDPYIWSMVAFLQKLPKMDDAQFDALVASSGGHSHGGGESGDHHHDDAGMPGHHHDEAEAPHHDDAGAADHHAHEADGATGSTPAPTHDASDGHKHLPAS